SGRPGALRRLGAGLRHRPFVGRSRRGEALLGQRRFTLLLAAAELDPEEAALLDRRQAGARAAGRGLGPGRRARRPAPATRFPFPASALDLFAPRAAPRLAAGALLF